MLRKSGLSGLLPEAINHPTIQQIHCCSLDPVNPLTLPPSSCILEGLPTYSGLTHGCGQGREFHKGNTLFFCDPGDPDLMTFLRSLRKGMHFAQAQVWARGHLPSCHSGEHIVCIIQMGSVGSSIATPMLAKQMEPGETAL